MRIYFDDEAWVIRYLVVSTGTWLANRKVLISPVALSQPQWAQKLLRASLTKEQVKNSRQEIEVFEYYGCRGYWAQDLHGDAGTARS